MSTKFPRNLEDPRRDPKSSDHAQGAGTPRSPGATCNPRVNPNPVTMPRGWEHLGHCGLLQATNRKAVSDKQEGSIKAVSHKTARLTGATKLSTRRLQGLQAVSLHLAMHIRAGQNGFGFLLHFAMFAIIPSMLLCKNCQSPSMYPGCASCNLQGHAPAFNRICIQPKSFK